MPGRQATLPGWLRAFVDVNPVSHLVTAERALMAGTWAFGQVGWVLLASGALTAVFGPLTMRLYRSGRGTRLRRDNGRYGRDLRYPRACQHSDVSASGLRSPDLTAVVTHGHLSAAFTAPPYQVSITLSAAQAALRLPAYVAYRVTQEVKSGFVRVAIPQAGGAARTVTARLHSGELELLPS